MTIVVVTEKPSVARDIAQALYETPKLISYPHAESHHTFKDMVSALTGFLEKLDHPVRGEVRRVQSV